MAYNSNFYNDFDSTFQEDFVPPPPLPPPPIFPPPTYQLPNPDQDFVKKFERKLPLKVRKKPTLSIHKVRNQLHSLVRFLNSVKEKEKNLTENIEKIGELEWKSTLDDIEYNKKRIKELITSINTLDVDVMRKLLVKRAAKRARLRRLRAERKIEKEELLKKRKERSRKIDENLQKIKDEIEKAKQEEEAKIEADMVLKETLRKKNDAKKCITKLEALVKLRIALYNTAKGRGENVSENEAKIFESNMEKLKTLWSQKLAQYEHEEAILRQKLKPHSSSEPDFTKSEQQIFENLYSWKSMLFGGKPPQYDFDGDVDTFVSLRAEWDQYIHNEGTTIPIGWVVPTDCFRL